MLLNFYNWLIQKASHPSAKWYLFLISFLESSLSFIPPDPLMVPMIVAQRALAWQLAFLTTSASVLGGILGYAIGFYVFESIGIKVLETYGLVDEFFIFKSWFDKWGVWAIIAKGFTPIPFKLVTITCGAIQFSFWKFISASLISRGLRFYLEAFIVWKYGPRMNTLIQKNIVLISFLFTLLLVLGVVAIKYLKN